MEPSSLKQSGSLWLLLKRMVKVFTFLFFNASRFSFFIDAQPSVMTTAFNAFRQAFEAITEQKP